MTRLKLTYCILCCKFLKILFLHFLTKAISYISKTVESVGDVIQLLTAKLTSNYSRNPQLLELGFVSGGQVSEASTAHIWDQGCVRNYSHPPPPVHERQFFFRNRSLVSEELGPLSYI